MNLVTGATGLLGNCVVRELDRRRWPVRVFCRRQSPRDSIAGMDVEVAEGDLRDADSLRRAIHGCSAVIHCGALIHIGWSRLAESRAVNVEGTRNVIAACRQEGCRLVHVSTVDTLPAASDAPHPIDERSTEGVAKVACAYVLSKSEGEQLVHAAVKHQGLDAVIAHPGLMLGPYDWKPSSGRMMLGVHQAPLAIAPAGGCSVCDARDVAAAVVNAIDAGTRGESYILAGQNLSYRQLWGHFLRTAGRQKRVFRLGPASPLIGKLVDGYNRLRKGPETDVNGAALAMGALLHYYDSTKAELQLRYQRRPLDDTLRDAWRWLQVRHLAPATQSSTISA